MLRRLIGLDYSAEKGQESWNENELSMEAEKANCHCEDFKAHLSAFFSHSPLEFSIEFPSSSDIKRLKQKKIKMF